MMLLVQYWMFYFRVFCNSFIFRHEVCEIYDFFHNCFLEFLWQIIFFESLNFVVTVILTG